MRRKFVVIGGVAGGMSFAARVKRLDPQAEVVVFEKGPDVSFSNCSLPYHLSGIVPDAEDLILNEPESLEKRLRISVKIYHEVLRIDPKERKVLVKDLRTEETFEESYEYLALSPGASPIRPKSIEGIHRDNVFTVRTVDDIEQLKHFISGSVKHMTVVGGGFIGIEVAENLKMDGIEVSLVEAADQVMTVFDYDMAQILHKEIYDKGCELIVGDGLKAVLEDRVVLNSGREIMTDGVVAAIGVAPDTKLAKEAGLDIGETGSILVNDQYQTSDPHIFAIGDAIEVKNMLTGKKQRLALAGPAQFQARAAANYIYGLEVDNKGFMGSSVVKVCDLNAARTGLSEKEIIEAGYDYDYSYVIHPDKVSLMPDASPMHLKLLFDKKDGKILGGQAIGKGSADKQIDIIATAIRLGGTIYELQDLELCYAPPFSNAKSPVNQAGLVAVNLYEGVFEQVHVSEVRELVENAAFILDVRPREEFKIGHLKGAINIPYEELDENLDQIPKDRQVYVQCRGGKLSYFSLMKLKGYGYDNIINIAGAMFGISQYEYYNDQVLDREPILTNYIF